MPHNEKLEPKKHPYRILFGQRPLTKFKDYTESIKVELSYAPDRSEIMPGVYDFVKATWSEDGDESSRATDDDMKDAMASMLSGKALQLGLETIPLMFKIKGISRIDTHQIVRQRIGVTFSQQCTGDRFLNHNDVLIEPVMTNSPAVYENLINATLHCKNSYAQMVDNNISIQAAREIMPHNLETFINMNTNLATFLFFFMKRIDDGSQTWVINEISRQMAEQVCEKYPELKPVFEKYKTKFKLSEDTGKDRKNRFATALYTPDPDNFEYHKRDFLYNKTKTQMHKGKRVETKYFWGFAPIDQETYELIQDKYNVLAKLIDEKSLTNKEIFVEAKKVDDEIVSEWVKEL